VGKTSAKTSASKNDEWIDGVVLTYGDLLYDLCQTMLWSPADAPDAYRAILRTLARRRRVERFTRYERIRTPIRAPGCGSSIPIFTGSR
jgi:hypothetical protein